MTLPTIWQNDAFRIFLREAGYQHLQWNDGLKEYLVFILSASPTLTLNDLLKLYYNTYGTWEIQFTPDDLFILGQYGLWWDASSTNYITQDSAGTIPVTIATDPVGLMIDRSGNGNDGTQATTSLKPLYQTNPSRIVYDKTDDRISTTFASSLSASMVMGTTLGTVHCDIDLSSGLWSLPISAYGLPGNDVIQVIIRDPKLSQSEIDFCKNYLVSFGSALTFTPTTLFDAFNSRTDLIQIYLDNWDTSAVTNFAYCFYNCTRLSSLDLLIDTSNGTNFEAMLSGTFQITSLDISNLDFSNATSFINFVRSNVYLESLTVGDVFSNTTCTNYTGAFRECALDQTSVDNILVSINNAGTSGGTLSMHSGTNATPSAIGRAATDALRGRGWTVTLNGY